MRRLGRGPASQRQESRSAGHNRWLLSYADFLTLLLALFVVLYASALVDADKNTRLFEGLQAAFFFHENSPNPIPVEEAPLDAATEKTTTPSVVSARIQLEEDISHELETQRLRLGEDQGVHLFQTERGLVISLASTEFFPAGGVEIPPERRAVLAAIAPLIAASHRSLQFEGHTDAQPIGSDQYPSNWELSAARAAAVARLFIDDHGIDPKRVATVGYAEFRPVTTKTDPASRALNRRVEIVILEDGELVSEPSTEAESRNSELDQLLDGLPPIPADADESLKAAAPGPPPEDIPLP